MMTTPLPIEIVGGGLTGLALGVALRRRNVPVTLCDAGNYPRHRVCGEFISGLDPATARELGVDPYLADARPHRRAAYFLRGQPLPPFDLPAPAFGISRRTLDHRLAEAFAGAGGRLLTGTRAERDAAPGRVFAAGHGSKGPFWVGLKVHVRNLAIADDFEIHLGNNAYLGMSKVEDGAVNACGLFAPQSQPKRGLEFFYAYLEGAGLGFVAERIRAAEPDAGSFCVTAAPLGGRTSTAPDRVVLGDAYATIPPFTGNGLAMALQGAALAVEPLQAYAEGRLAWNEVRRQVARAQHRRFRRRLACACTIHPFILRPHLQPILASLFRRRLVPMNLLYGLLH